MSLLDKIERRFRRFAVPHVTIGLILCQVVVFAMAQGQLFKPGEEMRKGNVPRSHRTGAGQGAGRPGLAAADLRLRAALHEYRLCLLLLVPVLSHGRSPGANWGALRYNVYLLIGYIATVAVSFLTPQAPASIGFLEGSVFLAFAAIFPDFVIQLFFLLPVKIKWLALLTWIGYFFALVFGAWTTRLLVLASMGNFLVFFGKDILYRLRIGRRSMALQARRISQKPKPYFHRCTVCGITDQSHPQAQFRYCRQCDGQHGYCMEHLRSHEHVKAESQETPIRPDD